MRWFALLLVFGLLLIGSRPATAQPGQTRLTVSGSPSFTINTAIAGNQPAPLVDNTTSYGVTAKINAGVKKIVGQINALMPTGTTLSINLTAVSGSTSMGPVVLDMTARDLEVNISQENHTNAGITYIFTATVAAGVVPSQSRSVILTLLDYP